MAALFAGTSRGETTGYKVIPTFNEKNIYPVLAPIQLLSSPQRRKIIQQIKDEAGIPEEYYDSLYRELLYKFTAFVQILPVNNEAKLGGLLDEGLMRALYALQIQQKANKGEVDPVMSYVIFSAALLVDVGCVIENRTVIISAEDGSFIQMWDPYHDGIMPLDKYYRIRHGGGVTPWSSRRSVIALASQLMPVAGFDWIYKNPHAFNIWLALLVDDKEGAGSLRLYFERAREMLEEFKISAEFFIPLNIEEKESPETEKGEDFIAWLKEALESGKISADAVNSQIFHVEGDKLLFTEDLFKRYAEEKSNKVSWNDVLDEFKKLGFINGEIASYIYSQQRAAMSGIGRAQGLGSASSLFGKLAGEHENVTAENQQHLGKVAESAIAGAEMRIEKLMAAGGRVDGYVVNMVQGFVVPVSNYPVALVSVAPQQALANQLPSSDSMQKAQQEVQDQKSNSQLNLTANQTGKW